MHELLDHLYPNPHEDPALRLVYGDLADGGNLSTIINAIKPDVVCNLGAQTHVCFSLDQPIHEEKFVTY